MFERRLKIVLVIVASVAFVLIARAAQVQIFGRAYWKQEADSAMRREHLTPSVQRGSIMDRMGRVLAVDQPCVDACVEYPALTHPPDPDWLKQKASDRLSARLGEAYTKLGRRQRLAMRDQEVAAVAADVDAMWAKLGEISGKSTEDIEQIREDVIRLVQMRQHYVLRKRVEEALRKQDGHDEQGGALKRLLADDDDAAADAQVTVTEQKEAHVILRALDPSQQNALGKNIDRYPGLVLRPGTHRFYPYADIACHVLGNLARVSGEDISKYNKKDKKDPLRDYQPNDLIGRTGVEALCEPALRGTRGQTESTIGDDTILTKSEPLPGQDVRLSIDVELQQQIQEVFASATLRDAKGVAVEQGAVLHGAAVVLKVDTNEVLALVSYPTFDLNRFEELYPRLHDDDVNEPLRNRATMSQLEPGSTVKPLCGLTGVTIGAVGVNEGIECTGYLMLDGRKWRNGRCWVANSSFTQALIDQGIGVAHHPVPEPHKGHDGNADGFLTFSDGLERSCNVYFETVADRLGIDRLSSGYEKFGLGHPTGIGITEVSGRLPRNCPQPIPSLRRMIGFSAGIGQGYIAATPIQMANATATIARNGIWMRPRLILPNSDGSTAAVREGAYGTSSDRVDLQLPPQALAAAREGMFRVVNGRAGTGKALVAGDKLLQTAMICGKTGTAQASKFMVPVRDESGKIVRRPDGRPKLQELEPSTPEKVNPQAPWYRMTDGRLDHAWYVGFAPADHPQVAFAVLVEYGGSGGVAAASVAREALEACISRGYLAIPQTPHEPTTQTVAAGN